MNRFIILMVILLFTFSAYAEEKEKIVIDCVKVEDPRERLNCYDAVAPPDGAGATLMDETSEKWFESSDSAIKKRLKQEFSSAYNKFVITPHKPNYIMPFTYNNNVNTEVYEPFKVLDDEADDVDDMEVKYQLSLKIPITDRFISDNTSLWFAYTQVAYWQLYNSDISAPFRETNYEPEMILFYQTDKPMLGMRLAGITLSFNHQSNGRSEPLSRSWNRIILGFHLESDNMVVSFKPWYRLPEDDEDDNNPNIENYLGYADFTATYKHGEDNFNMLFRNNLKTDENRSSVELNWSFPLSERLNGMVQYINAYGDGLVDYNHRNQRIGIGVMLTDWL